MKRTWAMFLLLAAPALADTPGAPPGWQLGGNNPAAYETGTAPVAGMEGRQAAYIRAGQDASYSKQAALSQTISAEDYRGKRVRMTTRLKGERVERLQLWVGVDRGVEAINGRAPGQPSGVTGTVDWEVHGTVLQVPDNARTITIGVLMRGATGRGWIDAVKFETLAANAPGGITPSQLAAEKRSFQFASREIIGPGPWNWGYEKQQHLNPGFPQRPEGFRQGTGAYFD